MSKNRKMKITAEALEGRGYIRITDTIGTYSETGSAAVIRAAVDSFLSKGIKQATIYLTTAGGSTFEMEDICNELDRLDYVEIFTGSMVASAGTRMVSKYYTTSDPLTKFMIHMPEAGIYGNHKQVSSQLKPLMDITNDYRDGYAAKTKKTPEEIEQLWADGEKWFTAKEALELGLIDGIGKPVHAPQAVHELMVTACANCEDTPDDEPPITDTNNKSDKQMDKLKMIAALGLAADASDEQILAAAQKAKEDAEKLSAFTAQAAAQKKERGIAIVAQAIAEKRILADVKEIYEKWAIQDPDGVESVIKAMAPVPQLSTQLGGQNADKKSEERKDWTLATWQEKDPKGLEKLYNESPEEFEKLLED